MSTLELQLASLEVCKACRSVPTLRVRVANETPSTLWAPRDELSLQQQRQQQPQQQHKSSRDSKSTTSRGGKAISSRVPAVQMVDMRWAAPSHRLLNSGAMER